LATTQHNNYKKHKLWFVLFALFALTLNGYAKPKTNPNRKYTQAQLVQDYNYLSTLLIKCHPGLTRYTTADSVTYWFNYYRTQITDSMTQRQFRKLINKPIEKIKCGHTATLYSTEFTKYLVKQKLKFLPIDVVTNNNKLYVLKNNSTDTTLVPLTEISSINGNSAQDILHTFNEYITADGYIGTGKQHIYNANFARFYRGLVDSSATQIISIKHPNDSISTHTVACIIPKDDDSGDDSEESLTYLHDSIAVIDLNSFASFHQRRFLSAAFKELQQKQTPNLVLDLRSNGGGQVITAIQVLSYLLPNTTYLEARRNNKIIPFYGYMSGKFMIKLSAKFLNHAKHKTVDSLYYAYLPIQKAKQNAYKGKLFVLVDGGSFSASVIVAAYLKRYNRATIIGQETGGTEEGCNAFTMPMVTAPNTGLQLRLPLYQVNNVLPQFNYGRGVQPNYIINENLQLPSATTDACMQEVLRLLSIKNK
jgi:hypothetical protein